jgi:hypothetical protein
VAAASLAGGVLAQSGSAAPQLSCHGHVSVGEEVHSIDENGLVYHFGCSDQINGFSVIAPGELVTYSPSAAALGPAGEDTTVSGNKEFECGGDLPGFAQNCGKGIGKAGYALRGEVGTDAAPCTALGIGHWLLIVVNPEGTPSGPFDMGKTRGCPKPPKPVKPKTQAKRKPAPKAATKRL